MVFVYRLENQLAVLKTSTLTAKFGGATGNYNAHHVDCGDNVIIINADKVQLTGNKWNDKVYLSYTGYPGGQREMTPARLKAKPNGDDKLLRKVVKGMLPKNKLGDKLLGNMYVYAGSEHKHQAQNPKSIDINLLK